MNTRGSTSLKRNCFADRRTVVSRNIEVGQTVAADATPLFLVAADLQVLRLSANVGEKDIGDIKPGDKVSFEVEAFPNRVFPGEVRE